MTLKQLEAFIGGLGEVLTPVNIHYGSGVCWIPVFTKKNLTNPPL